MYSNKLYVLVVGMVMYGMSMSNVVAQDVLQVFSSSFAAGGQIPKKYSYKSNNISPQLSWSVGPKGTKSYVVICQDPDAPTQEPWVHWLVFHIPAYITDLKEGLSRTDFSQGQNDYKNIGWDGPNPPSGTHRYYFTVYALDSDLSELQGKNPTKVELIKVMQNHNVLAQGTLMGTYTKNK